MATTVPRPAGPAEIPGQESARALHVVPQARPLPKKLTELGRIRIGDREENRNGRGTHPHKLTAFRLTSSNRSLLQFAAGAYGGEVRPWEGEGAPRDEQDRPTQYELYTTANAFDVLIPTFSAVSCDFEQWSAAGCQRRCTGETITHCPLNEALIGTPCTCPTDEQSRAEDAKTGKACARILRLNVLLPDLPGMGTWRLETKGYYATAELLGTLDLLQMAGQEHQIIEAVLRLEDRSVKRPGKGEGKGTLKFAVPVLWPKYTPRQIMANAAQRGLLLMAPPAALPPPQQAERAAHAADELYGDGGGANLRELAQAKQTLQTTPPVSPAGTHAADYVVQLEALLSAQGGDIPTFWAWAERQKRKPQAQFTEGDYADLLTRAQSQAQKRKAEAAQETTREHGPKTDETRANFAPSPQSDPPGAETNVDDPEAKNGQSPPVTAGDWRGMLTGLLETLQDATLAQEGLSILEDADVSDADGNAFILRVLNVIEAETPEEGTPF